MVRLLVNYDKRVWIRIRIEEWRCGGGDKGEGGVEGDIDVWVLEFGWMVGRVVRRGWYRYLKR